jgi:hypothetical protein
MLTLGGWIFDWRFHRRALLGCMMSINPDTHSIAELDLTQWGCGHARNSRRRETHQRSGAAAQIPGASRT